MSNNPFMSLVELYAKSVEKEDAAGMAEVYKLATRRLFNMLKEELANYDNFTFTVTDEEYLDGYFIFGTGTNSVVHFHIKETPGWKYGIWWAPVEKSDSSEENTTYETDVLHCSIFTQYEEEIDKFKPSASMLCESFNLNLAINERCINLWNFARDIKFIHDEPYLAFYREVHYSDFNREYVSREVAEEYYRQHLEQRRLEKEINELNNKEMLKVLCTLFKDDIDSGICFICDRNKYCSPRYQVVFKNTWAPAVTDGYYDFKDFFDVDNITAQELIALFHTKEKECKKRAEDAEVFWASCYHSSALLISAEAFDEYYAEYDKVSLADLLEEN